jgi:hypothetical protein
MEKVTSHRGLGGGIFWLRDVAAGRTAPVDVDKASTGANTLPAVRIRLELSRCATA